MPTTRITPNGTPDFATGPLVGAGSIEQALSDNRDATYVELDQGGYVVEDFSTFFMPYGAVVKTVTNWVRAGSDGAGVVRFERNGASVTDGGVGVVTTAWVNNTFSTSPSGAPMATQAEVDGYRMRITSMNASPVYVAEAVVDITYAEMPSEPTVTAPSGTVTNTTPTVTWVHHPGADAVTGQTFYRVRVYEHGTETVVHDAGELAGAGNSYVLPALPINKLYDVYVYTAQTTSGVTQYSFGGISTFSIRVDAPTCVVTAPTGVLGTTSPTVRWTHTPGVGAQTGQTFYRIRMFDVANLAAPVTDTGPVAGAATSAVVGPLDPAVSWRVVVNTAQTTNGVVQWSPDASSSFTIDVSPALISSVVATAYDSDALIAAVVTWNSATPPWQTFDVEATYDGGATWGPVRGWTARPALTNPMQITDHEAPNDTPAQYRARATRTVSDIVITGPWTLSNVVQWHNSSNDTWVKDPAHPSLAMKVCISVLPESTYGRTVGVFRPIGARFPVTVSDVMQAPTSSVQVMTRTRAEETALLALLAAPVLLVQPPNKAWSFGSNYVAPGTVVEGRIGPTSPSANRLFTIELTVVDRPA